MLLVYVGTLLIGSIAETSYGMSDKVGTYLANHASKLLYGESIKCHLEHRENPSKACPCHRNVWAAQG